MSNTDGGWTPQDPYREQGPDPRTEPAPQGPYGSLDPYGRPANPYGRPDYYQPQAPQPQAPQPPQYPQQAPQYPQDPQYPHPQYPQGGEQPMATRRQQHSHRSAAEAPPGQVGGGPATVGAAWRWGWSAFGASWGTWLAMSLVLGAAQLAVILVFSPSTMAGLLNATDPAAVDAAQAAGRTLDARGLSAAGTAVCFMLQALLYAGALAATRARTVRLRDFFVLRGVLGLVGYAVIVGLLGFVGAAVPMVGALVQVVFTLLLLPVPFLLLKGYGFGRSIGTGVGLVLSHIGAALAIFGIFAGLAVASIFTCGLGLVVVGPVMLLLGAYLVQCWTDDRAEV